MKTKYNNFIKENNTDNELCFFDEQDETIYVNKSFLYNNYVGEGVDAMSGGDHEIIIAFIDNTWGGIRFEEWESLYEKYNNVIKNNIEITITSNVSHNRLYIEFETEYELSVIDDYQKRKQKNKSKKFNL